VIAASESRRRFPSSALVTHLLVGQLVCLVLALLQTTNAHLIRLNNPVRFTNPRTFAFVFSRTWPTWAIIALAAPFFVFVAKRYAFDTHNRGKSVVVHMLVASALSFVQLLLMATSYYTFARTTGNFGSVFFATINNLGLLDPVAYWAILGLYLARHQSTLRADLAEARLAVMRAQMNPHFLFNSLHAVSALALKGDQHAVAETLGRLSDLLRVVLDDNAREVPFIQEMKFLDSYLMIQDVRFADRLRIVKSIAPEALDALVPTLILQPLVENAVEHGLQGRIGSLTVEIIVSREDETLLVAVRDNGPGFPSGGPTEGIGLANTRGRLEHIYGQASRFTYGNSATGGAVVQIRIPFRRSAMRAIA